MRSPLDSLITERSLVLVNNAESKSLVDNIIENGSDQFPIPLCNVCAKVSKSLSDDIDSVCDLLGISKRRFIEAALIQAVGISRTIMENERVFDVLEGASDDAHA